MLRRQWQAPHFVTIRSSQWHSSHDNSECQEERGMPEEWGVRSLEGLHVRGNIYNLIPNLGNEFAVLISANEDQNKNQSRL